MNLRTQAHTHTNNINSTKRKKKGLLRKAKRQ
jgi:hypothetical protein